MKEWVCAECICEEGRMDRTDGTDRTNRRPVAFFIDPGRNLLIVEVSGLAVSCKTTTAKDARKRRAGMTK